MTSDYTFFVTSTINSTYGKIDPIDRMSDTAMSLAIIRKMVPDARILLVDNSNEPVQAQWRSILVNQEVDFVQLPHNLFSLVANEQKLKSASEANLMFMAFNILRARYADSKRIFKISGRYRLSDTFDVHAYDGPEFEDKYTFVVQQFASTYDNWKTQRRVMRLETGLISFTPSLIDEFQAMLSSVIWQCLSSDACIEEALFQHVPHQNIVPLDKAHVEGNKAEGEGFVRY
jgi:hypothetical protein